MVIQSFGQLAGLAPPQPTWQYASGGGITLDTGANRTYLEIYQTQPNVRTLVDFLARNVAQLGLHVFRRVSDTDRERLNDHPMQELLRHPNPSTTTYRLIETLMQDLGIYFNAYWLKVRATPLAIVRVPPEQMKVLGTLLPTGYQWTKPTGERVTFATTEVVHIGGFGAGLEGLSTLETLRRRLSEEASAIEYRQQMWTNATRVEGVIERPKDAPKWSPTQKQSWREQWQGAYGAGGSRPGSVAILEDGMTFRQVSYNPRDLEYSAARKLGREEGASAYHIPPPMVGILEHATFSNITEQHKMLYSDTLGPWLKLIVQEIERQLLPEFADIADVYLEFNIAEKLRGSFEQQASSLNVLVGRPIMTANEGRARLNLPRLDDPSADELAEQQGGPAAAPFVDDTTSEEPALVPTSKPSATSATIIARHRARQADRLRKVPAAARSIEFRYNADRWTAELAADLAPVLGAEADAVASLVNADTLARLDDESIAARENDAARVVETP